MIVHGCRSAASTAERVAGAVGFHFLGDWANYRPACSYGGGRLERCGAASISPSTA